MATKVVFKEGKKVISDDEYVALLKTGDTADLESPGMVEMQGAPEFSPIGLGKPLLLELLTAYTGDLKTGFFGNSDDVLVTSAVKTTIGNAKVQPLAINLLKQDVKANEQFSPGARTEGSPVIFYSPSLTASTVFFNFQAITNSFDKKLIEQISKVMTAAGKMPIFVPAKRFLLASGELIKIFSTLGDALLESAPFLQVDIAFRFDTAGVNPPQPQNMIIHNDADAAEFHSAATTMEQDETGVYLAVDGKRYTGPAPYAIINVDGNSREELSKFGPTQAATGLLNQFYGSGSDPGQVIGVVQSALSLYNDSTFNKQATALQEKLGTLKKGSKKYLKTLQLLKANAANITDPNFKVTLPKEEESEAGDKKKSTPDSGSNSKS